MRNRVFGAIGVVWGGLILVSSFFRGGPQGAGAYAAGQTGALVFAVLLVIVGGYYLLKSGRKTGK
jgi:predicted phage tail protein